MATGVVCGLQNRHGVRMRPGWVRFPHVPATVVGLAVLLLASPATTGGQEAEPGEAVSDAAGAEAQAAVDSVPPVSPLGALVRSLVIPGWGQAAVGRPERGAIYFLAGSAAMAMVFKSQAKLNAARRAEPPDENLIDARSSQRENWIVLYGFVAFVSALDAWVSTHFWHFEPEVTMPEEGGVEVGLSYPVAP